MVPGLFITLMLTICLCRCVSLRKFGKLFSELILKNEIKKITLYKANSVGIYLLKVINRNTGTRCKICSKLAIKTPEQRHWRHSGVFIDNFEHISYPVLVFLLLTLNT